MQQSSSRHGHANPVAERLLHQSGILLWSVPRHDLRHRHQLQSPLRKWPGEREQGFIRATLVASASAWAGLMLTSAAGQILEEKTFVGSFASAPVSVMALAAVLAAAGAVPTACSAYDAVWQYVMPLGAALYLLETDLTDITRLWQSVGPTTIAWAIGAVGIVLGTLLAWGLLGPSMGDEGAKVAAALCASYIGGSINFAATASALGLTQSSLLAGAMAADNAAMAVYLAVISSWPVIDSKSSSTADSGTDSNCVSSATVRIEGGHHTAGAPPRSLPVDTEQAQASIRSIGMATAAGATAIWGGNWLAHLMSFQGGGLACMAAVAAVIAAGACGLARLAAGRPVSGTPFAGSSRLGSWLMLPFFATIGAAAGNLDALPTLGPAFCLIAIQLVVHVAFSIVGGRLLHLPMDAILTASNANVGGPGTAAATASARSWSHMVQPAVLTGSLGYAVGTAIGCAVGGVLLSY